MFAGPFAMIFYGVQIFQETGKYKTHISKFQSKGLLHKLSAGVNAHMAAVVVAILRVVGGLVALVLIKKLPRYFRLSSALLETWQCDRNTKKRQQRIKIISSIAFSTIQSEAGDGNDDIDVTFNGNTRGRPLPERQGCGGFHSSEVINTQNCSSMENVELVCFAYSVWRKHTVLQKHICNCFQGCASPVCPGLHVQLW